MIRFRNGLISMAAIAALVAGDAHADEPPAPGPPEPADPPEPARGPVPIPDDAPAAMAARRHTGSVSNRTGILAITIPDIAAISDAELVQDDANEIFDERLDKPFDRDTQVRLTGAELAAQGAVDLATALALLPDVTVRDLGRGGLNVELRGARDGAVSILIDGVVVSDPYYGTFDVSTIPITDIVQIRVTTTPRSPLDGPGGSGGVIEVHTRDATGPQLVIGRITANSAPSAGMTGTARVRLARRVALRISASGLGGTRDLALPGDAAVDEDRHAVTGAGQLEYRRGDLRVVVDGSVDDRHYLSPPSDVERNAILLIDRETTARTSARADGRFGALQLQVAGWSQYLNRRSRMFVDPALTVQSEVENLEAVRSGAMALATRPFVRDFRWIGSATVNFEKAVISDIANRAVVNRTTLVEAAGGLLYDHKRFHSDVAGGIAIPAGAGTRPWPEVKGVAAYDADGRLTLVATGAYKGRVPTLYERYDPVIGNSTLRPERTVHGELRAIERIDDSVYLELAPYYKQIRRLIEPSDEAANRGRLANRGNASFWGVDAQLRVAPGHAIAAGASYSYVRARSTEADDDAVDRVPSNRADAWIQGRFHPRLSGLARVVFVGSATDQDMTLGRYALVSASATARITREYLGVLRVDDLFDARPQIRAGYHAAGRAVSLVVQATWE